MRVNDFDVINQATKALALEPGIAAPRDLVEGVAGVNNTLEAEYDILGIELAGWLEPVRALKLDTFTQVECIFEAIITDRPTAGKRRQWLVADRIK